MTRLIVTFVAAVGAYLGITEVWAGSKVAMFTYEGFPVSYRLLATGLVIVLALCVGR